MPPPERPRPPSREPRKEHQPTPYYQAARYQDERPAKKAYTQAQNVIYGADVGLSVYRFLLDRLSHVAAIGTQPPPDIERTISAILSTGEPVTLPQEILTMLIDRRRQAQQMGSWVERHYRPGIRVYPDDDNKP